jgi:hypothetical protein
MYDKICFEFGYKDREYMVDAGMEKVYSVREKENHFRREPDKPPIPTSTMYLIYFASNHIVDCLNSFIYTFS